MNDPKDTTNNASRHAPSTVDSRASQNQNPRDSSYPGQDPRYPLNDPRNYANEPRAVEDYAQIILRNHHDCDVQTIDGCRHLARLLLAGTPGVPAAPAVIITGAVTRNGTPLPGVAITGGAGVICTKSDANGQYSCTVPANWNGTLTPSLSGHTFDPGVRTHNGVVVNQGAQDFAAVVPGP